MHPLELINLFPDIVHEFQRSVTRSGGVLHVGILVEPGQHTKGLFFIHMLLSSSLCHFLLVFISFTFLISLVSTSLSYLRDFSLEFDSFLIYPVWDLRMLMHSSMGCEYFSSFSFYLFSPKGLKIILLTLKESVSSKKNF